MKVNFEIEGNYAIQFKGELIDLHNNFDLIELIDNVDRTEVCLKFIKSKGDWVRENEFSQVKFLLKNVTYKHIISGESNDFQEDAKCLSEITFFPSDQREVNDSFTSQRKPNENDDLLFFFQNGNLIRINCEEAEVIVLE